jgi:hypothetical protein
LNFIVTLWQALLVVSPKFRSELIPLQTSELYVFSRYSNQPFSQVHHWHIIYGFASK